MDARRRQELVRVAAPVAFLLAATIAIVLVRSSLNHDGAAPKQTATAPKKKHEPRVVPVAGSTTTAQSVTTTASATRTHIVAAGDTLGSIAAKEGTTVDALLQANPGVTPTNLQIGEKIAVP
jgi:LysM repeat protein